MQVMRGTVTKQIFLYQWAWIGNGESDPDRGNVHEIFYRGDGSGSRMVYVAEGNVLGDLKLSVRTLDPRTGSRATLWCYTCSRLNGNGIPYRSAFSPSSGALLLKKIYAPTLDFQCVMASRSSIHSIWLSECRRWDRYFSIRQQWH